MHVDAAYGGPAMLADDLRPLFAGIERADSIAFDPHKWLYTPHSGGCVLVRDLELMRRSFDLEYVSYIVKDEEHTDWGIDLGRHSPNFSRGFWALKVWVSLLAHGRDAYARRISHDAALARYLGAIVEEREDFELMTPVGLSITCFRYVPSGLPAHGAEGREEYLDLLNERIMTEIQLGGRVYCSNAVLQRPVLPALVHRELPNRGRRRGGAAGHRGRARREARRRAPARHVGGWGTGVSSWALLGSGEFEPWHEVADRWLLERATGDGRVVIAPTASAREGDAVFEEWGRKGLEHFASLDVEAEVLPVRTRDDAERDELAARLEEASVVYFSGGNPAHLSEVLRDTAVCAALLRGMARGMGYAGCSAGVACLTETTFDSDSDDFDAIFKPGLGIVRETLFGPHWDMIDTWVPGATEFIVSSVRRRARVRRHRRADGDARRRRALAGARAGRRARPTRRRVRALRRR